MNSRVDEKGKQIKTRLLTAKMQWIKNERDCLVRLFEKHGYKIKNPGEHEWEEALNFTTENNKDSWIDSEFKDCFQKKQTTQNLIQKIKQGIKGIIARVKKLYDAKIRNYEKQLNGYDFIDEKGEPMHSYGCAEVQKMFLDDTTAKTFRQIADDIESELLTQIQKILLCGAENIKSMQKKLFLILKIAVDLKKVKISDSTATSGL